MGRRQRKDRQDGCRQLGDEFIGSVVEARGRVLIEALREATGLGLVPCGLRS